LSTLYGVDCWLCEFMCHVYIDVSYYIMSLCLSSLLCYITGFVHIVQKPSNFELDPEQFLELESSSTLDVEKSCIFDFDIFLVSKLT